MFNRTAAPKPKNIRKIVANDNCLFRAFSFCLTGSEEQYLTIWHVICNYMEFYSSMWQLLVGTHTVSEYSDRGVRTSGIGREHKGTKIESSPLPTCLTAWSTSTTTTTAPATSSSTKATDLDRAPTAQLPVSPI
uniref:Ubiquitinyl hydrolase 1 n=1 Tax=Plectus sambesii TaxID=2011161 RepID=A0A914WWF8_9BILA